ncbi:MAG TPA: protein kinase [Bryobacteraceae bacterium]
MPLRTGVRIGPYEISGSLGAGGMGEVYRARDARLNRDVAIKTLPAGFADDPNRLARFQREAQVLASLSHPNIAAIYGLEESEGVRGLVMELVDGPTLGDRIAAGPMTVEEALPIARQIADALEAAHEKGVVHRDLKPANIKLTADGKVKVLDFGLAKALGVEAASGSGSDAGSVQNSPTLTLDSTRAGMILGTAGYMAPEQARGKPVDKRTDIWAFGVVLHEMLAGKMLFEGETVSDTLAAVLRADIDWDRLPADTPPKVKRLLRRCLERDPKKRLRDIGDAWIEMDAPEEAATAAPVKPPRFARLPWAAGAVLAIAGVAWGWLHTPAEPPRPVLRWTYTQKEFFGLPALSRDGTRLVYAVAFGSSANLWLRMMDQLEGKPIPGGENAVLPAFSPDGQWIVYMTNGSSPKLKKIPVTGGASITLADATGGAGEDWGDDDTIVFSSGKGLMRIPASGGAPEALTTVDSKKGETGHRSPRFLPGGRTVLYTIVSGTSEQVAAVDLKKGVSRVVVASGWTPAYAPTGHLLYVRGGTLFALPFHPAKLEATGSETPVVEGVSSIGSGNGTGEFTFSEGGLLVFMSGANTGGSAKTVLAWADRKGTTQPMADPQTWGTGRLSPDGLRVANEIYGNNSTSGDIWVFEIERRTQTRLTFEGSNEYPIWSPDGRRIAFGAAVANKTGLYTVAADGSGKAELLLATDKLPHPSSWSPDGKMLIYTQPGVDRGQAIWVLPLEGGAAAGQPRLFHDTRFTEYDGELSPDGRWLAYVSTESGASEVYVQPFPGPGGKIRISTSGGSGPRWSRNGRELFYWSGVSRTGDLQAVEIQTAPAFRAGIPQPLFKLTNGSTWDPAPDGKRFMVEIVPGADTSGRSMEGVVNWFDELRKRAPAKK